MKNLLPLVVLALSSRAIAQALPACRVTDTPKPEFAAVGEIHEFRVTPVGRGDLYSMFSVNARNGAMIGGLNACGDNGEKTYYRAERLGAYVIYTARCGGWRDAFDGKAVIVFEDGKSAPVYVRSALKIAWGVSASIHSGPIKSTSDDLQCAAPGFDSSRLPFLAGRFQDAESYVKKGALPTESFDDLYKQLERQNIPQNLECQDGTMDCYFGR